MPLNQEDAFENVSLVMVKMKSCSFYNGTYKISPGIFSDPISAGTKLYANW